MSNEIEILNAVKKIQPQVEQIQKNIQQSPTNAELFTMLKKIQEQVDDIQKNNKLLSPEHIAQALGFKLIKDEITQVKNLLISLSKK